MRTTYICAEIYHNRKQVLVVDSDANMQMMLQRVLERKGVKADTARDITEAFLSVKQKRYDVLLIDIGQKPVEAWNDIERLQNEHRYLSFIITSNFPSSFTSQRCRDIGVLGLLIKPYEIRDLDNVLNLAFSPKNT